LEETDNIEPKVKRNKKEPDMRGGNGKEWGRGETVSKNNGGEGAWAELHDCVTVCDISQQKLSEITRDQLCHFHPLSPHIRGV
jgi:hypothetical protein